MSDGGPVSDALPRPDEVVDAVGRPCPVPVILLARLATTRSPGDVVGVLADDPAAVTDIPAWARMRGHTALGFDPTDDDAVLLHLVRLT